MAGAESKAVVVGAPPCVLCGHGVARRFPGVPVPTVICQECGLVFTWPVDAEALRRLYRSEYDYGRLGANRYPPPSPWDRQRAAWIGETLSRDTGPHRVLEIGCNAGALLSLLAAPGRRMTGLEPGQAAATFAREQRGLDVTCAFWEEAQLENESLDAVVMVSVLEHFQFPLEALVKVRKVLRPGGWLLCEIPNVDHERGFFIDFTWKGYEPTLEHLFCYSSRSVSRLLIKAGFDVVDVEPHREVLQVRARRSVPGDRWQSPSDPPNRLADIDARYDEPAAVARKLTQYQRAARRKWPLHAARKAAEVAALTLLPARVVDTLRSSISRRVLRK